MEFNKLIKKDFIFSETISKRLTKIRPILRPTYFYKLTRLFFKKGKALGTFKLLLNITSRVYLYLNKRYPLPKGLSGGYLNTSEFIFVLKNSKQMYNVSTIID